MSRARVEELADLLEGGGGGDAAVDGELAAMATLAEALRAGAVDVRPDPTFRSSLRADLIVRANAQANRPSLLARFRELTERWRYSARLAAATAVAAVAVSGGGVAAAAEHALPGDVLYPVKLVLEDARVWLTPSQAAKGRRQLAYGAERIDEAWTAAEAGDFAGSGRALVEAEDSIREGSDRVVGDAVERGDSDTVAAVAQFIRSQRDRVTALVAAHGEVAEAAEALLDRLESIDSTLQSILPGTFEPESPQVPGDGSTPVLPPPTGEEDAPADPDSGTPPPAEEPLPDEPLPDDPLPSAPEVPLPTLPEEPLPDDPLPSTPETSLPSTSDPADVIEDVIDDILTG